MDNRLTIVMYHYVRDLARSRYPEIKGLTTEQFRGQIGYIKKHYHVISADFLMDVVAEGGTLPPRALLLTFDDGYSDHFTQVFPILDDHKISGAFFPPGKFIHEHKVLDVNKIHFILAAAPDKMALVEFIDRKINQHQSELKSRAEYWDEYARPSRYDPAEIIYIKRMLQRGFPRELRKAVVAELFQKYVTKDEAAFSHELYLTKDQIRCMHHHGMCFGSHGYDHYWLDRLTKTEQETEIDRSLDFLKSVGVDTRRWVMCYPHGAYNDSLLSVLGDRNCLIGLGTEVGIADLGEQNLLTLKRLNTNDLPMEAAAPPNQWTQMILSNDNFE